MTKKLLITIVVPFFNEQENLGILFDKICSFIKSRSKEKYEILFINDCSTDQSAELIKKLIKKKPNFFFYDQKKRSGQSGCFNFAFKKMKGDYFIRIDSDLQDDPKDLTQIVNALKKGKDIVLGVRKDRKHSYILLKITEAYDSFVRFFFKIKSRSFSCSMLGIKYKFIRKLHLKNCDHRFLPLILVSSRGAKLSTVNVSHHQRLFGKSKYNIFKKLVFGFFEFFRVYIRIKKGEYDF